jgi:putative peptide zinc metalloprotease protein
MVELALASIAMIFWTIAEPGLARAAAFNVMLIGGVSTLLFNGNPLLRFDAYYILADLIESPNLGVRANKYFWYLCQRYLLGLDSADDPRPARGEAKWLVLYAVLSFAYRITLSLAIAVLVATRLLVIGVILAAVSLGGTFLVPVFKGARFVLTSPRARDHRTRAVLVSLGGIAAIVALLFVVPLPYGTVAEGVVWVPERTEVRAGTSGVVAALLAAPDSTVADGLPLISIEDATLDPRVDVLKAQREELVVQDNAVRFTNRVQADVLAQQVRNIDGALAAMSKRRDDLIVRATLPGRLILPDGPGLVGRYVKQGDLLGYVVGDTVPEVRAVVEQGDVDLVRARTQSIVLRYATDMERTIPAHLVRAVPAAQFDLPSMALATQGGGTIVLDSRSQQPKTLEGVFVFDLEPDTSDAPPLLLGSRVYVRFDHGAEPVAWRWLRGLRQIFLKTLNV